MSVRIFPLNTVPAMPLTAAKNLSEAVKSLLLIPIVRENQVDTLYTRPIRKMMSEAYRDTVKTILETSFISRDAGASQGSLCCVEPNMSLTHYLLSSALLIVKRSHRPPIPPQGIIRPSTGSRPQRILRRRRMCPGFKALTSRREKSSG